MKPHLEPPTRNDEIAAAFRDLKKRRTALIAGWGAAGVLAGVWSWVSFDGTARAVMAASVFLAVAPVLAALAGELRWLGAVDDPARWRSGTGWWDPPIQQGNVGAFSRLHIETEKGGSLSAVMWRGRHKAWEGPRPVRYFADQNRLIVSPTSAARLRVLKRS